MNDIKRICITGAAGYLGRELIKTLAEYSGFFVLATDVVLHPQIETNDKLIYHMADIRDESLAAIFGKYNIDSVVHLASIVNPGKKHSRAFAYSVDVDGTKNVLEACLKSGVKQIIVTSSGAAYGYYADNPVPLTEDNPVRGNYEFAYAHHKKLVEELLASYRKDHPNLKQLIFRPGTILGETVSNQITELFEKNPIPALKKSDTPFVFIWDRDVVAAIMQGLMRNQEGIYNLAGDNFITLPEIARRMGHKIKRYPEWVLKTVLFLLKSMGKTPYGPEQTRFIAYRPVLSNDKLKNEFGYVPQKTSEEVFELYRLSRL